MRQIKKQAENGPCATPSLLSNMSLSLSTKMELYVSLGKTDSANCLTYSYQQHLTRLQYINVNFYRVCFKAVDLKVERIEQLEGENLQNNKSNVFSCVEETEE